MAFILSHPSSLALFLPLVKVSCLLLLFQVGVMSTAKVDVKDAFTSPHLKGRRVALLFLAVKTNEVRPVKERNGVTMTYQLLGFPDSQIAGPSMKGMLDNLF